MASKIFGGANLERYRPRGRRSAPSLAVRQGATAASPCCAAAELALTGRVGTASGAREHLSRRSASAAALEVSQPDGRPGTPASAARI